MILQNPGLELDWSIESSHKVLVIDEIGDIRNKTIENIFTPPHWVTWFKHIPGTYDQPEVRDAWKIHDPNRVHSGKKAILLFTFFRGHDAGFMQKATAEQGKTYKFSAWAHAWSNHNLEGYDSCNDNGRCSCGVGTDVVSIKKGDAPELNGDSWNDAIGNFTFNVGIDPTGGNNPFSEDVVWGDGYHIYNGYCKQLEVEATAVSSTITVFMRSKTLWAFKHNDAYWDDTSLTVVDGVTPGRGQPRVQYDRTYVLMPPDATEEFIASAVEAFWNQSRYTVGGSADDAGVGDLDSRTIIAINPDAWQDPLDEFYANYYKGVLYYEKFASSPQEVYATLVPTLTNTFVQSQNDPRWKNKELGEAPGGNTIGEQGCMLVNLSMILRKHYGTDIYPDRLNYQLSKLPGAYFNDDFMNWHAVIELFSTKFDGSLKENRAYTIQELSDLHQNNWEILLRVSYGAHFVLLNRIESNKLYVIDPWDGQEKIWSIGDVSGIRATHVTDGIPVPPPPPPLPDAINRVGMHLQTMKDWVEYTQMVQPPVMKVLPSMQDVSGIKRQSINTAVVWRHVTNDYGDTLECPDPMQGARNWIDRFRDSLYDECDKISKEFPGLSEPYFYVESLNEVYPSLNIPIVTRAVNFDMAFIDTLAETGLPVKPVVFTAAVGNPHETEYELIVPLARKCANNGGLMGYHTYWRGLNGESLLESEWEYYAGRWTEMDEVFSNHGIYVQWFGGEGGVYSTAHDGWRSPTCYNGDWSKYLADIVKFNQLIAQWNVDHNNRFLGTTLFTTGSHYTGWENFQLGTQEMSDIMEALK